MYKYLKSKTIEVLHPFSAYLRNFRSEKFRDLRHDFHSSFIALPIVLKFPRGTRFKLDEANELNLRTKYFSLIEEIIGGTPIYKDREGYENWKGYELLEEVMQYKNKLCLYFMVSRESYETLEIDSKLPKILESIKDIEVPIVVED